MNRLWSRLGVRAASVALLLTGVAGGVYLGQDQEAQQLGVQQSLVGQAEAAEMDLLKERHAEHAAARAPQRKAEAEAAQKAATEAKAAASRARKLEKAAIAKKAAEKKAAEEAAKAAKAAKDAEQAGDSDSDSGEAKPFTGPIPASCGEYRGNRKIGCALLLDAGFSLGQMPCLDKLFKKESGWNHKASNRSSGAYGIPQALPGKKMASAGSDWRTNPATQIEWGLGYIKGRYNTPCNAWSHSQNTGWY